MGSPKLQAPRGVWNPRPVELRRKLWDLGFPWSLGFGFWSLALSLHPPPDSQTSNTFILTERGLDSRWVVRNVFIHAGRHCARTPRGHQDLR